MTALNSSLDNHVLRLLVRYFRSGGGVGLTEGELSLRDDLEFLRIQWALSSQVENLVCHLLENRHEAQASLETVMRTTSGVVRGRLDSVQTLQRQRISGDTSAVCYHEPRKSFSEGPNHVLSWVLRFSMLLLQRHTQILKSSAEYNERVHRILRQLGAVLQLKGIGDAIYSTSIRPRPSISSVSQSGRSRRSLYRKAFSAYQLLRSIESGDDQQTIGLLNESLLGPLEEWQKFELLLAFKLAESLAKAMKQNLVLHPIVQGSAWPIASFGPCDVYWQNRGPFTSFVELEPSEAIVSDVLQSYGVKAGWDRPDVVICDRVRSRVVAVAEAKYSINSSSWSEMFRDAVSQLVRYTRNYRDFVPQEELLRRSVVAVSNLPADIVDIRPSTSPLAFNITDLISNNLGAWTERAIVATY
jgi:hypothetical protein